MKELENLLNFVANQIKIDEKYFNNPKDHIVEGAYCYNCPFWDIDESKPTQMNGYCHYLKRGDWEDEDYGLLWDKVKECGVKDYSKWCLDCKYFKYEYDCSGICYLLDGLVEGEDCCNKFVPKEELMGK